MLERWTRTVLRHRALVLACWLGVLVVGLVAAARLPGLLSTDFTVPGSDSERARTLLARHFEEQPEGTFVVVFEVPRSSKALEAELHRRLVQAARLVPTGRARDLERGGGILYAEIDTALRLAQAKGYANTLRESLGNDAGPPTWVTGQPAIQHDVDPVLREDLRRAELVAVPIALAILLAVLGLSFAVLIPLVFAACTITATLAIVYVIAQVFSMATYVPALVELLGLGLAIDYSLLVVHRHREELVGETHPRHAVARTMATAGRTVIFSGMAVAIGLALLLLVPVPFIRSMGIGGLLVPVVSIAAVLTLQPVLISLLVRTGGRRRRAPTVGAPVSGFWVRLGHALTHRPTVGLAGGTVLLLALSIPFFWLQLTPGSISNLPEEPEAMHGFALLRDGVGPGEVTPTQIVVDSGSPGGSSRGSPTRAAIDRLADRLFHDPEVFVVASGSRDPYVDESRRYARVVVVGRHEYGTDPSEALVHRIRDELVPAAEFPPGVTVHAGGPPPQGVDFLARAYGALTWVVLAVLAVTFAVLLRAFRSLVLPLEAVILNLLTVSAVCGLLVVWFQWGAGERLFGLTPTADVEGWVPIFLFATLFGLSMDYQVFLVTRMREAWDELPDNRRAVVHGLARTGRVVTAAAAIMVVAFAGFVSGRIVGLQQLGLGLALGVLLDATVVRMLVLPSLMALVGRWNWWLPGPVARVTRLEPSAPRR